MKMSQKQIMKRVLLPMLTATLAMASPTPVIRDTCEQPDGAPAQYHNTTVCPCWSWYTVQRGDDCGPVADAHGITKAQLESWNPWLNIDGYECVGLWAQEHVCVGTTAPSPLPKPPCNKNAPYPVGEGTVCGCKKWYNVQRGDDCGPVAAKFGITTDQLYKWNPWLAYKDIQCAYLFPQSNVCVGTSEDEAEL